jgi:Leucine-rich repeat (LRR) protein
MSQKESLESSFYKIQNQQKYLKTLQVLPFSQIIETFFEKRKIMIDKNTFGSLKNLKILNLKNQSTCFQLKNGSFNGMTSLNELVLDLCEIKLSEENVFNDLKNLNKLELSYSNQINSKIISNLSNLVELDLFKHEPESLLFLNNLKILKILRIHLKIVKSDYLQYSINLKELYLRDVEKIEKYSFLNLHNLVKLDISRNFLSKLYSNIFMGLKNLKELNLEYSTIARLARSAFNDLSNLEYLNMSGIRLQVLHLKVFKKLKKLKILNLKKFHALRIRFNPFKYFQNIEELHTNFRTTNSIQSLSKVRILTISCKNIEKTIKKLSRLNFTNLSDLTLISSFDNKTITMDVFANERWENLKKLKLVNFFDLEIDPLAFDSLIYLEYLDLSQNKLSITQENQDIFKYLMNLKHLNLSKNKLFNLSSTIYFRNLNYLNLSEMECIILTDKMFDGLLYLDVLDLSSVNNQNELSLNEFIFYGLNNLKKLILSKNNINYLTSNLFRHLVNLVNLDLSKCHIKTVFLYSFNGLVKLENIDLSQNEIENLIEDHFNDLISLKRVNIHNNPFIFSKDIYKFKKNLNLNDLIIFDEEINNSNKSKL